MKTFEAICKNPWCKAIFRYTEDDMIEVKPEKTISNLPSLNKPIKIAPDICPKCKSFDTELSGGVEWKDIDYEGDRIDGSAQEISYSVNYYKNKYLR
jgi:hypothetical protein